MISLDVLLMIPIDFCQRKQALLRRKMRLLELFLDDLRLMVFWKKREVRIVIGIGYCTVTAERRRLTREMRVDGVTALGMRREKRRRLQRGVGAI